MYSFPSLELVCCSMSGSNCCFLTYIQVRWSGIPICLRIFHSSLWSAVKCFSVDNETVDVFLEFSIFFYVPSFSMFQRILPHWSLVPLPFLNPAWTFGSSQFTYCLSLAWRILSIIFASMWDECNCEVVWTFFDIALLWDLNENWPFPILCPLQSFLILLAYWVQHFHSIIF